MVHRHAEGGIHVRELCAVHDGSVCASDWVSIAFLATVVAHKTLPQLGAYFAPEVGCLREVL